MQQPSSQTLSPIENYSRLESRSCQRMLERFAGCDFSPAVLAAMQWAPRHRFIDAGLAHRAYEDIALPIGCGQTISSPSMSARMLSLLGEKKMQRVLEIGTGCGYQATLLSKLAQEVYSVERIKALYEKAKLYLRPLSIPNIRLHHGDGCLGLPDYAPFDGIIIAAAGAEIASTLLAQLSIGARLIAPIGTARGQILTCVERISKTQWSTTKLEKVFFVPLQSGVL